MTATLPIFETALYFSTWISVVFYSVFRFSIASKNYFSSYNDVYEDFKPGWSFVGFKKDKADFEWETILYLLRSIFPWILGYLIISEVIRYNKLSTKFLQQYQIGFTLFFIVYKFGYLSCFFILFQPLFFTVFSLFKRKFTIWVANLISLVFIALFKQLLQSNEQTTYLEINEYDRTILVLILCWINLKITSYYLEVLNNGDLKECLAFCLYFPTVFSGPFLPYEKFKKTYNYHSYIPLKKRFQTLMLNILRFQFWMIFTEFILHFVYVNATSFQTKFVQKLDTWSLCGYGYCMGQFFHLKYVILYGLSTSIANFENINVPNTPRCIGRIHLYSDMWRYFDPGLYAFLSKYIYLPLIKQNKNKLIPSLLCFVFVYIWHGVETYILIWSVLNYLGVSIEYLTKLYYENYLIKKRFVKNMSDEWKRRLKCFLAAPLLCVSAISNFYFFSNMEIGNVFASRVFEGDFFSILHVLLALYCCCQVSTDLANVGSFKL